MYAYIWMNEDGFGSFEFVGLFDDYEHATDELRKDIDTSCYDDGYGHQFTESMDESWAVGQVFHDGKEVVRAAVFDTSKHNITFTFDEWID